MLAWTLIRRLLAQLIRLLLLNPIVTMGVLALLVVGVVVTQIAPSYLSGGRGTTRAAAAAGAGSAATSGSSPSAPVRQAGSGGAAPAPAVEEYIRGMTSYNANLMWNSLSPDAIGQMQSKGGSLEKLQAGLDDMKNSGARYEEVSYVGAYPLKDGSRYFFFVMTRRGFAGPDAPDQVYFVFTVGNDGKIARIE